VTTVKKLQVPLQQPSPYQGDSVEFICLSINDISEDMHYTDERYTSDTTRTAGKCTVHYTTKSAQFSLQQYKK